MTSTSFNVGMATDRASSKNDSKNTSSSSGSESDDEDYVPSSKELKDDGNASEENSDDSEGGGTEGDEPNLVGRKRGGRRRRRRAKQRENDDTTAATVCGTSSNETNIDDLWNEFKKDCESAASKTTKSSSNDDADRSDAVQNEATSSSPKTKTVTQLFEFAGEAVEVPKEVPIDAPTSTVPVLGKRPAAGPKGLSSILGQIGKKNKLSVLEKSKLDWNNFKTAEGIREDLEKHNKGKDGYLEKQDFLQRADLRQFEIEKAMRSSRRTK